MRGVFATNIHAINLLVGSTNYRAKVEFSNGDEKWVVIIGGKESVRGLTKANSFDKLVLSEHPTYGNYLHLKPKSKTIQGEFGWTDKQLEMWRERLEKACWESEVLSDLELSQLLKYIALFQAYKCDEHYEVNNIITNQGRWDEFFILRSLNDHGSGSWIRGIEPKYFAIICNVLEIDDAGGAPLISSKKY